MFPSTFSRCLVDVSTFEIKNRRMHKIAQVSWVISHTFVMRDVGVPQANAAVGPIRKRRGWSRGASGRRNAMEYAQVVQSTSMYHLIHMGDTYPTLNWLADECLALSCKGTNFHRWHSCGFHTPATQGMMFPRQCNFIWTICGSGWRPS